MRVLVASDTIASLSSARAGALLAEGWPRAQVTVVPVGEAGAGFAQAAADQLGVDLVSGVLADRVVSLAVAVGTRIVSVEAASHEVVDAIAYGASSVGLGRAVRHALDTSGPPVRRLVVDMSGAHVHDGGAGFMAALGAEADAPLDQGVAPLAQLTRMNLDPARNKLLGVDLVGVVPSAEIAQPLLGLRGITSLRGRDFEEDRQRLLDTDGALANLARLSDPNHANAAGAGACGGVGFAILALGGRLVTGPRYAFEPTSVQQALAGTDLVVTGCTHFDFATRGGGVVAEAAWVADRLLSPCIAVAGRVSIGGREMRTMGVESAYPLTEPTWDASAGADVPDGGDVTEVQLAATARRVGRSWQW